jgi:hypothetical protein
MATIGLYGNSQTGAIIASSGAETLGLYGNTVNFGGTFFEWFIFKEAATQPTTPTGGSWDFTTNTGTPPSGWTLSPPTAPSYQIWASIAYVNSKTPTVFTWSTPGLMGVVASTNVGTTTTGASGTSASVNNSGTSVNAILNFTIPKGDVGTTGSAATIAVGTTATTAPGTNATVTNSGSSSAAVFNFGIPKGAGVVAGGTAGQYLAKASSADYDTVWSTITGTLTYQGAWNALTNSPALASNVGTSGYYYVVSVAGTTNLNGITDWQIGDWAIFNGNVWQKLDQTNLVTSVAGRTGAVVLANTDISGLGTLSTQNANSVAITGGTESGVTHSNDTIGTYLNYTGITAPTYAEGRSWYDSASHALAYYNDVNSSIVHIGQDLQLKVINNTGSTIANGSPVYVTSTSSGQTYPNIALAKADVASTSAVIGLTNGAITNGSVGYVTAQGGIDNVNTGSFTVGQVLYLSPYSAGQLMNTIPPTGITVQVGVVSYVNSSTGKIYVKQTTPLSVPASIISGQVALANGGTGLSSYTAGDITYFASGTAFTQLPIGVANYVLTSNGTAPQWSPSLSLTGLNNSGNLIFTNTGNRITGDFSNTTASNRVIFQTSTANSNTRVGMMPNLALGGTAGPVLYSTNDPNNASFFDIRVTDGIQTSLQSGFNGTGTYLPMTFYTGGSERVRLDTSGKLLIGLSASKIYGSQLQVLSNIQSLGGYASDTALIASYDYNALDASPTYSSAVLRKFGSTAAGNLYFASTIAAAGWAEIGGINVQSGVVFGANGTVPLVFANSAERMRIDSSGNVGIGTSSPNASAILDAQSTTKGVRFPNMTTTQKNAISSPAAGLVVFDTTLSKLCVYTGAAWQTITSI